MYCYTHGDPDKGDNSTGQMRSGIFVFRGVFDSKRHFEKLEFLQRRIIRIMKGVESILGIERFSFEKI